MHLFRSYFCKDGVNFAIVLPKLALVKPIEHNERDVEGKTNAQLCNQAPFGDLTAYGRRKIITAKIIIAPLSSLPTASQAAR